MPFGLGQISQFILFSCLLVVSPAKESKQVNKQVIDV